MLALRYGRDAFFASILVAALATADAAHAAEEVRPGHELNADHMVMGAKGVSTVEQASAKGHAAQLVGFGVAGVAERTLYHERMSLELDLVYTAPGSERAIAVEPMAKLPWHLNRYLEPYLAAGPMMLSVDDGHGTHYWLGGGQLVFGALVWWVERIGLDLDVALGAARGTGMTMFEATFAIGPVLRG